MKIRVTGADGFVGAYLMQELKNSGHEVLSWTLQEGDLSDPETARRCVTEQKADVLVHLAAISGHGDSLKNPLLTWNLNTLSVEVMAQAILKHCPDTRLFFVSSAKVYQASSTPLSESHALMPADLYALSKMSADLRLQQLSKKSGLKSVVVRAFNHTGPGQTTGFLCPDLMARLRQQIEQKTPELQVGSLKSPLDLSDVRDVVRAYRLLIEKDLTGVYNVGSGGAQTVGDVVAALREVVDFDFEVTTKSEYDRSYSSQARIADITKIQEATGWEPGFALSRTLKDMWHAG